LTLALLSGVAVAFFGCDAARGPVFDWGGSGGLRAGTGGTGPGGSGGGLGGSGFSGLKAEYFQMPSYEGRAFNLGSLALTRIDPQVSFDWGTDAPDSLLPPGAFMVRWTGFVQIPLRTPQDDIYRFTVRSDDGVRLWVDERLLVDNWTDHQVTENSGDITLGAGTRVPIMLEYYQHLGMASVALSWSWAGQATSLIPTDALSPPTEANGLAATYYVGEAFDAPAVSRLDLDVGFRWALDSPDPAVPVNGFSARWIGTVEARYSESTTFFLTVFEQNEGVRLSVNGTTIIDAWAAPFALERSGSISLVAGQRYPITVEYFESIGASAIELLWASASQPRTRVSWHRLRP
jgi:hypothetical protein